MPILVAKVWRRNLDYAKNLQAKCFTGENIPIYGIPYTCDDICRKLETIFHNSVKDIIHVLIRGAGYLEVIMVS